MTALPPRLLDVLAERYSVERELASGGTATVYLAEDLRHDRKVAIKVLNPDLAASVGIERFRREIDVSASLTHPYILPLLDSGGQNEVLYYVMPYVEGETLKELLEREGPLPLDEAVQIAREVTEALVYAHAHEVVHRDIKPGNILLEEGHALVADFGIARATSSVDDSTLTDTGLAVGTPAYMSPEQAFPSGEIDGRSDLYSLGCVMYQMLTGEPPFGGKTPQHVLARHVVDPPHSIHTVRPGVPEWLEDAVLRCLQKSPPDRFADAQQLLDQLEAGSTTPESTRPRPRRFRRLASLAGAAALAIVALLAGQRFLGGPAFDLDVNRVAVFPLLDAARPDDRTGENVATLVGYALEDTEPLQVLDGWDWLAPEQRNDMGLVTAAMMTSISRDRGAAFFVDGSILRGADSVTVVLRLHDVIGDSVVSRAAAQAAGSEPSYGRLGLRALGGLLPALVGPGREVDVSALADRNPGAVANWLLGESAYRRARFEDAQEHFVRAVEQDSALAVAALAGAQAAGWRDSPEEARALLDVALAHNSLLPARRVPFARGLSHYLAGEADSAGRAFRRAIAIDESWAEAWMYLGETHYHLLPSVPDGDSVAAHAFRETLRLDPDYTPALLHLTEIEIRSGNLETVTRMLERVERVQPDSSAYADVRMMARCAAGDTDQEDWREWAADGPLDVLLAGKGLAVGGAWPRCSEAALTAVLQAGSSSPAEDWGALLVLQSLYMAQGRYDDLASLLESDEASSSAGVLRMLDAAAGAPFTAEPADVVSDTSELVSLGAPQLWVLGLWEASRGNGQAVGRIRDIFRGRAAEAVDRRDRLLGASISAHASLASGDTTAAFQVLTGLRPSAPKTLIPWYPWESLGPERLALAQIFLRRGDYEAAIGAASLLDYPEPASYLIYLPASLSLRIRAAQAIGRTDLVARYENRLDRIRSAARLPASSSTKP